VRLGVVFPQTESGTDVDAIREYIEAVEEAGYDHLGIYDHVLGASPDRPGGWRGPYTAEHLFHEVMVFLGYLAAITTRIELTTSILILPQRQTALVAKQAAEIDVLSGGRFRLGVGLGWNPVEYEALGADFGSRGRRIEEQVEVLRRLWSEPDLDYSGDQHHISNAGLNPLPTRSIPIWMGASAEAAKRRVARLADGWMINLPFEKDPESTPQEMRTYVEEAGRDPGEFGIDVRVGVREGIEQALAAATRWEALGVTHLTINTMRAGLQFPKGHVDALRRFKAGQAG
jgi:probable F420-dependent oxidoreductase